MKRALRLGLIFSVVFSAQTAFSQDFEAGWAAYDAGDYETALKEWLPLAEQGDAYAQGSLGMMYANGEGVPQDYTEAKKWFGLAAEQ